MGNPRRYIGSRQLRTMNCLLLSLLLCAWPAFAHGDVQGQPGLMSQTLRAQENPASSNSDVVGECPQAAYSIFVPLSAKGTENPDQVGFALSLPDCRIMVRGYSGSIEVRVVPIGDFSSGVVLALAGTPEGISGDFAPSTLQTGGTSTLTLNIGSNAATGSNLITVQGTAGDQVETASIALQVVEPLMMAGRVEFDTGSGIDGAQVRVENEDGTVSAGPVETTGGNYMLSLPVLILPAKILVQVEYTGSALPILANAKWQTFASRGAVQMDTILLPDPEGAELAVANGGGQSDDAALQVNGLTGQVDRLFGRVYDADADADLFPGEFAERVESGQVPLNSSGFVWIVALDAQGNPVSDLSQAAVIRARIPLTQWPDLEDIQWGTDRIETPIYTFDESEGIWEQMGIGWLEDGATNILAEEEQARILDGTFPGEIYATFRTTHFSFMNVDYAYYGPWTLSRIDREKRNNDCFFQALRLAKSIALSPAGQRAYGNVNSPGASLPDELADGKGPEIKTGDLDWSDESQTNGEYNGDNMIGDNPEDEVILNNKLWEFCDDNKPQQKEDLVLLLASTLLHETAHWKDDVKKHSGANDRTAPDGPLDTAGEEGKQLERDLFGGDLHFDPDDGQLELDGEPIDGSIKDLWLNPDSWEEGSLASGSDSAAEAQEASPLEITISLAGSTFSSHESIPAQVTYRNVGIAPIRVLNRVILEDYPLRFAITHISSGKSVGFLGPELDIGFGDGAYVTLAPGETLQKTVDLNLDESGRLARYNLRLGGQYQVKAIYTSFLDLPETESNTVTFTLHPGGAISGIVTARDSGAPVSGTLVYALLDDVIMGSAMSDASGAYVFSDLPAAIYTLTTRAAGFQRLNRPGVVVVGGQNTTVNLVLLPPPHLSYGQTITGTIGEPTEVYSYTFSGQANDNVLFRMAEVDTTLVPDVRIYRPDGTLLCDASSSTLAQELCLLDMNGKYVIAARSFGDEIGTFSLFVQRTSNPANATVIAYDESKNGMVLAAGAMVAYTFAGTSAERVLVRLAEVDTAPVPDVRIYRPDGTLLCDTSSSTLAQELCLLDATGTHTILAGSFGSETGNFSLFLQRTTNPVNATVIAYDESKNGTVVATSAMPAYTFAGQANERVLVRLAEVDTMLVPDVRIYRPDGSLLCDASSSTLAQELCLLDSTGTHTILAGSFGSETGNFSLFLQRTTNPVNATVIAYGESKNGTVVATSAMPAYAFAGQANERVLVRLAEVDTMLVPDVRIYRPDGTLLCDASSSTLAQELCTLDATGTHTILAGSFGSETGTFSLFVQRVINPVNAIAVAYGQTQNGTVSGVSAMVAYIFAGSAQERVLVRLAEVDTMLVPDVRIYRPDGTLLCDASSSTLAQELCLLDVTGTHTILAGSFGSETGTFSLFLQRTTNPVGAVAIAYGESKNGNVPAAGAMSAYTFVGTIADQVMPQLAEVDTQLVPDVRVYRPDGTLLCDASSSTLAQELCTLDATGAHTVLAGSFGSETGAYTLFLEQK